jgi:serine phosphatase RsbU (regulator of sigma subunit)
MFILLIIIDPLLIVSDVISRLVIAVSFVTISEFTTPLHLLFYSVLIISMAYFVVRSQTRQLIRIKKLLREKERTLLNIESQKAELESKNKSITDSLTYAQRIQEALLPSENYFRRYFKESFIFYKPKDIISGDFFWIGENEESVFIAAADCTGHGVPGALMSMIGHELLDKIINVDKVKRPDRVLEIMNKSLEKTFNREKNIGTIIHDGMDIGICVVDRGKRKIQFAGAFFPLYIIRDNRLIEFKGDKLILGETPEGVSFTNNEIALMDDDMVYLFSDGYVDQFGGSANKKFMYRRFRYLLMTIYRFPVEDQKSVLEENIKAWMGDTSQVDDILVMGFKPVSSGRI